MEKLFSQRKGLSKIKVKIQKESMDDDLRVSLWNCLTIFYWKQYEDVIFHNDLEILLNRIWIDYFKKPLDTKPARWNSTYSEIREYYFKSQWYQVYDIIEFIANNYPKEHINKAFKDYCNKILERELSAYRFVGDIMVEITTSEEISIIEKVLNESNNLNSVRIHIETALKHLSNRKSPDYRNSIKESISAVEALCKIIADNDRATLGQALKIIKNSNKVQIHQSLISSFEKLYGYTSDGDGIRHAILEEPKLTFDDAKYMLVSCSAFINFLISKSEQAGIKLN